MTSSAGADRPTPPKPAGSLWTDEQWAGVATVGHSLLVSAAAGSGKTAVLAERCAYLVCDASEPCDVDELLVVTFTEAAAAEMKGRIERAVREKIGSSAAPTPRLTRQLALIDRAQVGTLHGFCAKLIRQHFHLLDLDPAFTVIDGDEAKLLRAEVARNLFEERYERDDARAFRALIDAYADGDDERLIARIIQTFELTRSLRDPEEWLAAARRRLDELAGSADFRSTALGKAFELEIKAALAALARSCERSTQTVAEMRGFEKYVTCLRECQETIDGWIVTLKERGIDALSSEVDGKVPRLKPVPSITPGKGIAKGLVDAIRGEMKDGAVRRMLGFSTEQWRDGIRRVIPHAGVFLSLVDDFGRRYAREKAALRGVDFADLERLALRALRGAPDPADPSTLAPSPVARLLHRQFAHVLVDEYQDINEVQDAILKLASRECVAPAGEPGNLFCVGDVKQSIYRFRLAEPARFLERQEAFRKVRAGGTVIDLQANFRSRGPLLEVINGVFERLMTRDAAEIEYDQTQALRPGAKFPPADGSSTSFTGAPVELHVLPAKLDPTTDAPSIDSTLPSDDDACNGDSINANAAPLVADTPRRRSGNEERDDDEGDDAEPDRAEREALLIARRIRELVGDERASAKPTQIVDKSGVYRPIRYSDIVILLRSMRHKGDDYAEVLRRSLIPVHSESGTGYFESTEVADILALLKALDNRAQDVPLAAVLRSPIGGLPSPEDALVRVRLAYPDRGVPFHQAVTRYAAEHDDELSAKLKDVLERLDRWRTMAQRRPLAELIWDVYDSTGYLAFCAGLRDGEQRKANLIDLHDRARQFGAFQRQGLARFLAFLEQLREESDLGQPPVVGEGEDVVRIMTVHHSKGLEFPVVFIPDLGKRINLQDCSGSILIDRHAYLGMEAVDEERQVRYPSLASTLVASRLRRQAMAEELRVLYVAMTRAKEHLILVGTTKSDAADAWSEKWGRHVGPIPPDEVLRARSMLDWLGPVAAANRTRTAEPIRIIEHDAAEVRGWPQPESLRPAEGERLRRLARLEPLKPAPPNDPRAQAIIDLLRTPYPHAPFTSLAAVAAATAITKKGKVASVGEASPAPGRSFEFAQPLELPRAVRTEVKPSAADIGEATHLVLQYLDFAQACDVANLQSQIAGLVAKRLISPAAAQSVDLESICWLAESAAGTLIRQHLAAVRRELPLYLPIGSAEFDPDAISADPQDRVMVRSRLDLLVETSRGFEIVDYKTDRVAGETLAERVELYRGQMDLYRRAVQAITGRPPAAVHLVFLHARQIVTL